MPLSPLNALSACRRDEAGQSLIVIVMCMSVILGLAAFAIDASTWMLHHHQDQVVADSAALAAADCLANPGKAAGSITINGTLTPVPTCTSSTDTTDATTVAEDYAAANGVTITASQLSFDTTTGKVTVTPSSSAPGGFARLFGIGNSARSAVAGASWTASTGSCTTPGNGCDFMFADDSNCTSSSHGININANGNSQVSGNIQSNSNLSGNANGNISLGTGSFGPNGSGTCSNSVSWNGHDPWTTPPTQAATDVPFPIDYTKDFPACSGSTCDAHSYPSFCTNEGSQVTLNGSTNGDTMISGNIYCASGTGNPSDPSTWNGTITINLNGKDTLADTFVGGSINFSGNGKDVLSSCGYTVSGYSAAACKSSVPSPATTNYPIFYATGSGSPLNLDVNGSQTINGDIFVPNGTATVNMDGNKTLTTFIEAYDINATFNGTFQGDGPSSSGSGGSGGGSVSLVN